MVDYNLIDTHVLNFNHDKLGNVMALHVQALRIWVLTLERPFTSRLHRLNTVQWRPNHVSYKYGKCTHVSGVAYKMRFENTCYIWLSRYDVIIILRLNPKKLRDADDTRHSCLVGVYESDQPPVIEKPKVVLQPPMRPSEWSNPSF